MRADAGTIVPTRTAGLTRLGALADVVGRYGTARNYADALTTSRLSPYLRRRLVLEEEVLGFARSGGSFERVEKFVQEVVWRTYWKGWLEARPDGRSGRSPGSSPRHWPSSPLNSRRPA